MEIYLDHAATTYLDADVFEAMRPYFEESYGNASSQHGFGRVAQKAMLTAREQTAAAIGAGADEIYFTSGGTESDNWAIKGVAEAAGKGHIITTDVEHHAVLDTCAYLEKRGYRVTYLQVNEAGFVEPKAVEKAIERDTILISIMFANNETGVLMPVKEIGAIARAHDVLFHTDAVQAVGHVPIDVEKLDIDLLSISAHKLYGPKGIGALYIRSGIELTRFMHGGSQERGLRAGTDNTPGVVGLGAAAQLATENMASNAAHEAALAQRLVDALLQLPETRHNGAEAERLPGHVNISFGGIDAAALLVRLDLEGIAVSAGSACASGSGKPSYVLRSMGRTIEEARGAVRFTIGRRNTQEQIDTVVKLTKEFVEKLRDYSPLFAQRKGEKTFV